jgi:hypothetical protein
MVAFFATRIRKQLEEKAIQNKTWHPRAPPEPLDLTTLLATPCKYYSTHPVDRFISEK